MTARQVVVAALSAAALMGLCRLAAGQSAGMPTAAGQHAPDKAQDGDVTVQHAPHPVITRIRSSTRDPYGAAAKKAGLEGRVAVTFTLTPKGKPTQLSFAAYDEPELAYSAREVFGLLEFAPPPPPAADGSNVYVIGIVFCLKPSGVQSEFPPEAHVSKDAVIVISGTRLASAPVKTKKRDDVPDKCK